MSIWKSENQKKTYKIGIVLTMLMLLIFFALTAAAFSHEDSAYAENGANYKETAYAESVSLCDGTHTNYTAVSTSGGTISVSGNYYLSGDVNGTVKVTAVNVTLCLNGHDINASNTATSSALEITKDNFTLHDCGTHTRYYKIDSATKLATFDGATEADNDGSITGGAIRGSEVRGISASGKTFALLGGNVFGNKTKSGDEGAGGAFPGCTVKIENVSFIGNVSGSHGGALSLNTAPGKALSAHIKNTVLKHNTSGNCGGGLFIGGGTTYKATVTMENSMIASNNATNDGGGIGLIKGVLCITDTSVISNTATRKGGGIHMDASDELTLNNAIINNNICVGQDAKGGGIYASPSTKIGLSGVLQIKDNKAGTAQNNLFITNSTVTFDKNNVLGANSLIGITFSADNVASAIANINSSNLTYFKADDPAKMIVADGSGGLLYQNKPMITFKETIGDNTGTNTQRFEPNVPFDLLENPFSKEGHCFLGWSTNAFGITIEYMEKQTNVIITENADLTLYPIWHENHDGIEFTPVYSVSDIGDSGGNYVLAKSFKRQVSVELKSGTTNLCLRGQNGFKTISVSGSANLNVYDCKNNTDTPGIIFIEVASKESTITLNGGYVSTIKAAPAKEIYINGGTIGTAVVDEQTFLEDAIVKIFISGTPLFKEYWVSEKGILISTAYDSFGKVKRGATIIPNNGKTGSEKVNYCGDPIEVALSYAIGLSAPLYGQVVAEGLSESQKELIKLVGSGSGQLNYKLSFVGDKLVVTNINLFDDDVRFYRNNLWDTFRSPAYPSSSRPFHLYDLSAPFDAKMNRIDFSGDKYVKFELNKTYKTVADLPLADKNRIVNSLRYSTYSSEQAILNGLIVSEVLFNGDGTVNRILANVGLIWSLGEQGFLYTSLDSNGAFPYSGGIGTYVTFKAHNDGESIVDNTPKDDPLSKDDFDPDGDGNGAVGIPTLPDPVPPANNDIYLNYLGKVIDNNGNPLIASVAFVYNGMTYEVASDGAGYFVIPNFLVTAGQETATVYLLYSDGETEYGMKTYADMPIATKGVITYIYPLTTSTADGTVQSPPHTLTVVDYLPPTCSKEGNLAHFICVDITCGCGKTFGDAQGINAITSNEIDIAKIPHTAQTLAAVAATCTQTGLSEGSQCSVCHEILTAQVVTEIIPHTAQTLAAVAATCTQTGLSEGSQCSVCHEILTAQTVTETIPHTAQTLAAVAATCTQTGLSEGSQCSVCHEILTAQAVTDKVPHTEETLAAVAATCTQTGLSEGSQCSVCHEILTAQTVTDRIPHTAQTLAAVAATCTQTGLSEGSQCSVCDEVLTAQVVTEIIPHTAQTLAAVAATCTQTGLSEGSQCSVCHEILTAQTVLPTVDHSYNHGEVTTPPTTDAEGEKTYTCTLCGHTENESIPKLARAQKDINLLWLIILLSIINILELIAIMLLVWNKRKYENKEQKAQLNGYAILPVLLCGGQVVTGHLALSLTLGFTAILQAALIIMLALKYNNRVAKDKLSGAIEARFHLSRQDVIDRIEETADNPSTYPVTATLSERKTERACDCLRCGAWSFALMYESKAEVIKFMLRLEDGYAKELQSAHPCVTNSAFGEGEDWYKMIVDDSFSSKAEVFSILDAAYRFVLNERYTYNADTRTYETDAEQALTDSAIAQTVAAEAEKKDCDMIKLENQRDAFQALLQASLVFKPGKIEIAESVISEFPTCEIEAAQRPDATVTNLPLADTFYTPSGISDKGEAKKVCFGYTYQLKDGTIKIILKLPKIYAETQAETHKTLCRSKFPKGKGWYVFRIDNSFGAMADLMPLFHQAKAFVENSVDRD